MTASRRAGRHVARPAPRFAAASKRDQRAQILANGAERRRADVERLPRGLGCRRGAYDCIDEILDGEQLVPVVALPEDVDPAALTNPVEQDLEDAQPFRADEGLRAH